MHPPHIQNIITNIDDTLGDAQRLQQDAERYVLHAKASAHDLLIQALLLTQSAAIQARNALSVANLTDPRISTTAPTPDDPVAAENAAVLSAAPTPTPDDDPLADRVGSPTPAADDAPRPRRGRGRKATPSPVSDAVSDAEGQPAPLPEPDDLDLPGEAAAPLPEPAGGGATHEVAHEAPIGSLDDVDDIFGSPGAGDPDPLA